VKQRTAEDYQSLAATYLIPRLGDLRLSQLTPETVESVYTDLIADGLSARTVRYAHSVLHAALTTAVRRKYLLSNPAALATLPRIEHREMRAMTKQEASRFLAAARGTRLEALWTVLLSGGLRPGEALGLKWGDLQDDRVQVQRSLVRLRDHTWRLEDPKTARARRSVPLPVGALHALRAHKAAQAADRLRAGPAWVDHDLVFCNATGEPLEWRVVTRRYFKPLLRMASLPAFRPYDLRHTCATLLLVSGENPKVVQERLGHSSVALTLDVYSHVLPDMQQDAAAKLEAMLFAEGL
jgi:integrase